MDVNPLHLLALMAGDNMEEEEEEDDGFETFSSDEDMDPEFDDEDPLTEDPDEDSQSEDNDDPPMSVEQWKANLRACLDGAPVSNEFQVGLERSTFPNPGLEILDSSEQWQGPLPLPPTARDVRELKDAIPTAAGTSLKVPHPRFRITNLKWEEYLHELITEVCAKLQLPPVTMQPSYLALQEAGESAKGADIWTADAVPDVLANVFLCLPSEHTGGHVNLSHGDRDATLFTGRYSKFGLKVLAWRADAQHEGFPLTSGTRLVLSYALVRAHPSNLTDSGHGSPDVFRDIRTSEINDLLKRWPVQVDKVLYPLEHDYRWGNDRIAPSNFQGRDDALFRALRSLPEISRNFYLLLARATWSSIGSGKEGPILAPCDPMATILSNRGFPITAQTAVPLNEILGSRPEPESTGNPDSRPWGRIQNLHQQMIVIIPKACLVDLMKHHITGLRHIVKLVGTDSERNPSDSALRQGALTVLEEVVQYVEKNWRGHQPSILTQVMLWAIKLDDEELFQRTINVYAEADLPAEPLANAVADLMRKRTKTDADLDADWEKWFWAVVEVFGLRDFPVMESMYDERRLETAADLPDLGSVDEIIRNINPPEVRELYQRATPFWYFSFLWDPNAPRDRLPRGYPPLVKLLSTSMYGSDTEYICKSILPWVGRTFEATWIEALLLALFERDGHPEYPESKKFFGVLLREAGTKLVVALDESDFYEFSVEPESLKHAHIAVRGDGDKVTVRGVTELENHLSVMNIAYEYRFHDTASQLLAGTFANYCRASAQRPNQVMDALPDSDYFIRVLDQLLEVLERHAVDPVPAPVVEFVHQVYTRCSLLSPPTFPQPHYAGWRCSPRSCWRRATCDLCRQMDPILADEWTRLGFIDLTSVEDREDREGRKERFEHVRSCLPAGLFKIDHVLVRGCHYARVRKLLVDRATELRVHREEMAAFGRRADRYTRRYVRTILGAETFDKLKAKLDYSLGQRERLYREEERARAAEDERRRRGRGGTKMRVG